MGPVQAANGYVNGQGLPISPSYASAGVAAMCTTGLPLPYTTGGTPFALAYNGQPVDAVRIRAALRLVHADSAFADWRGGPGDHLLRVHLPGHLSWCSRHRGHPGVHLRVQPVPRKHGGCGQHELGLLQRERVEPAGALHLHLRLLLHLPGVR